MGGPGADNNPSPGTIKNPSAPSVEVFPALSDHDLTIQTRQNHNLFAQGGWVGRKRESTEASRAWPDQGEVRGPRLTLGHTLALHEK